MDQVETLKHGQCSIIQFFKKKLKERKKEKKKRKETFIDKIKAFSLKND